MYEYIEGKIAELTPAYAVVDAGGVGYYMHISLQTYTEIEHKESALVYVHHYYVRDDLPVFYGFSTKRERELFRMLVSVSGVGGNTARMILSTYSPQELGGIIANENASLLKNVKGLGLKTSQKIIVELKDKISGVAASMETPVSAVGGGVYDEALAALAMLGFARNASGKVVQALLRENPTVSVEELIRLALKKL